MAHREFLVDTISTRRQSYDVLLPRKESMDEFVNRYLRDNVLRLWPDGWMKLEELHKEFEKRYFERFKLCINSVYLF